MQQPTPSMMSSFPPANITTEQIQKYLDENKKLILAIMDNQNLGKLAECAQYQAQLQKNLMYLAAIADSQPQMATVPPQMSPHPGVQQGAFYMQQQAAAMAQPQGVFSPRMAAQFTNPLQLQQQRHNLHQQHQQAIPGQIHYRLTRPSSGMNPMQTEATVGGANSRASPASAGANKQDGPEGGLGGDGKGTSAVAAGHGGGGGGGEGDTSHRKSSEERK